MTYALLVSVITYYFAWLTDLRTVIDQSLPFIFLAYFLINKVWIFHFIAFVSRCLSKTYWVVVDVPYEAAQHGLLAHQGRHVDGGGLGVNQELPGLAVGGLGASWPEPLGNRARVPARAWNMREWEGHVNTVIVCCEGSFISVTKSAPNLFIFICFYIFCDVVWGVRVKRKLICQAKRLLLFMKR